PDLRLGALLLDHPKRLGPAVPSDDDARVSHGPLRPSLGAGASVSRAGARVGPGAASPSGDAVEAGHPERQLRAVAPTRLRGRALHAQAGRRLARVGAGGRLARDPGQDLLGDGAEPVRVLRALRQGGWTAEAALPAVALEHERVVAQLDPPGGPGDLGPVAP